MGQFLFWTKTWAIVALWLLLSVLAVYVIMVGLQPPGGFSD